MHRLDFFPTFTLNMYSIRKHYKNNLKNFAATFLSAGDSFENR